MSQRSGRGSGTESGSGMGRLQEKAASKTKVLDFNQAKEQKLEEKRRRTERLFFKNLIGVYTMIDHGKMYPVEIIDISEDGCSSQIPFRLGKPTPLPQGSVDLPMRLYFSQDTYLEIRIQIQNSRPVIDNEIRYIRYGCTIDKNLSTYPAFQEFVKFMKLYAVHSHKDSGKVSILYT